MYYRGIMSVLWGRKTEAATTTNSANFRIICRANVRRAACSISYALHYQDDEYSNCYLGRDVDGGGMLHIVFAWTLKIRVCGLGQYIPLDIIQLSHERCGTWRTLVYHSIVVDVCPRRRYAGSRDRKLLWNDEICILNIAKAILVLLFFFFFISARMNFKWLQSRLLVFSIVFSIISLFDGRCAFLSLL